MRNALVLIVCVAGACKSSTPSTAKTDAAMSTDLSVIDTSVPVDDAGPLVDAAFDAASDSATDASMAATKAPPAAAAVGYNTRTFGPAPKLGSAWYPFSFYGDSGGAKQNSDGSLLVTGGGSGVSTAKHDTTKPSDWAGTAFGGGAYFEATFSFTNATTAKLTEWPAFWANDIETMSRNAVTAANHWPGQATDYGDWIEIDFMEFDTGDPSKYGIAAHNWYDQVGKGTSTSTKFSGVSIGTASFAAKNRYGFLWVPATATTKGYGKYFFNDVQLGTTIMWDKYDSTLAPPPVAGTSAYGIIDTRHMAMIFDTGTENALTVEACSVWQISAANNIVQ